MNINYLNDGDILYKRETYKYRYKAIHEVEIEVLTMIHNSGNEYAFQVEINNDNIPKELRKFTTGDYDFMKRLGKEGESTLFNKKEDSLQKAMDLINEVMSQYI